MVLTVNGMLDIDEGVGLNENFLHGPLDVGYKVEIQTQDRGL